MKYCGKCIIKIVNKEVSMETIQDRRKYTAAPMVGVVWSRNMRALVTNDREPKTIRRYI